MGDYSAFQTKGLLKEILDVSSIAHVEFHPTPTSGFS